MLDLNKDKNNKIISITNPVKYFNTFEKNMFGRSFNPQIGGVRLFR